MDDQTFDERTAQRWIHVIESKGTIPRRAADVYPQLRAWAKRTAPARLLEIGCGQGACSDEIPLRGRHYTGLDASPFLIDRAKELYGGNSCQFVRGNAYHLPFSDGEFDGVFSVMLWHLLRDIRQAALEMSRVLNPGGNFLVIMANPEAYADWEKLYMNPKREGQRFEGDILVDGKIADHDVLYLYTLEEIASSMRGAGLEVGSIERFRKAKEGEGRHFLISIEGRVADPVIS